MRAVRLANPTSITISVFWLLTGWVAAKLPETLPPEQRKPMDWAAANPFNFIAMMRRSSILFCAPPPAPRSRQPPAGSMRQQPWAQPNPEPPTATMRVLTMSFACCAAQG